MLTVLDRRDTNADWKEIAAREPYWGVSSHPQFRRENLDDQALEAFYASGRITIANVAADLASFTGRPLRVSCALDFGCGVGRQAEALLDYADEVVGYDIAPAMLAAARARGSAVHYVETLPQRTFDWINAFIVFQHIQPRHGLALLRELLERLAPEGLISLHFTIWREARLRPLTGLRRWIRPARPPLGSIQMYDYDLGAIQELLDRHGVRRTMMVSTDHGGHHGVMILGRRMETAPALY